MAEATRRGGTKVGARKRPTRGAANRATRLGSEPPRPVRRVRASVVRGNVLDALRNVESDAAQAVVTSPPYWGLRDYGVPPTIWGGEAGCRHRWRDGLGGRVCERCDAWKGCLGHEATPDLYVDHLVEVMREIRRCLRPDGTLWLVLGDSFANPGHQKGNPGSFGSIGRPRVAIHERAGAYRKADPATFSAAGLKNKDLVGIPWRVAFALQADGWWLRSDNIWQKPNVMPESVRDRPTRAHEYVFLLSRSARYFYDSFAVREPDKGSRSGNGFARPTRLSYGGAEAPRGQVDEWIGGGGRNRRSVWTITSSGFRGTHTATFPEALADVCILAGTSPVTCRRCGAPWERIVESVRLVDGEEVGSDWTDRGRRGTSGRSGYRSHEIEVRRRSAGWSSVCGHDDPGGRCLVLDPFAGSGTTGAVAASHGRDFVGIELSREFAGMARRRIADAAAIADGPQDGGEG
jgi:DNA modification methylase